MNREGDLVYLILGVSQLSEQFLDLFLGHLVSEVGQDVVKLGQHHGAVGVLVEQLHQLQVVSIGALEESKALKLKPNYLHTYCCLEKKATCFSIWYRKII